MLKILDCMYFCTVMLSTQYSIGAYQTFNVTRVELIRIRHIPETRRALSMLHALNTLTYTKRTERTCTRFVDTLASRKSKVLLFKFFFCFCINISSNIL